MCLIYKRHPTPHGLVIRVFLWVFCRKKMAVWWRSRTVSSPKPGPCLGSVSLLYIFVHSCSFNPWTCHKAAKCISIYWQPCRTPWSWWRHQMETFSALLALCAGNSPVTGEFPSQRPVTRSFDASLICAWINAWVNHREAGDLKPHCAHYDVTVMVLIIQTLHFLSLWLVWCAFGWFSQRSNIF